MMPYRRSISLRILRGAIAQDRGRVYVGKIGELDSFTLVAAEGCGWLVLLL